MNVLDLFSGIGGFALGLERAGMHIGAFCESDAYCRRVLAKHWPGIRCYPDIRHLDARRLVADGIAVDVVTGGFPCQDISTAGTGIGLDGKRSRLWRELARIVGEVRPRFIIVENVAALLSRGMGALLGELAALRYDAEWHCIPASAVGAPHRRDRVWVIAADSDRDSIWHHEQRMSRRRSQGICDQGHTVARDHGAPEFLADGADSDRRRCQGERIAQHAGEQGACGNLFDGFRAPGSRPRPERADSDESRLSFPERAPILGARRFDQLRAIAERDWWSVEPDVGRVAHGIPGRVDRLRALGNAVVPQITEILGRAILEAAGNASATMVNER